MIIVQIVNHDLIGEYISRVVNLFYNLNIMNRVEMENKIRQIKLISIFNKIELSIFY